MWASISYFTSLALHWMSLVCCKKRFLPMLTVVTS